MKKLITPVIALLLLASCKSGPKASADNEKTNSTAKAYTWPVAEENEFMSGCVDSAKMKIGEPAAYAQCKCILEQLKSSYPNMDSAAPALMDVKYVANLAEKCKGQNAGVKK
ncbi:MAG TPA: hypothetical protein VJ499_00820 [Flavisolibacter sp.]|nr:hypothetical protein [Flavisolibacter sp.]